MTTISLRMDDQMKKELDEMCEAMGMKLRQIHFILNRIWHSFANLLNK